jgi:hypothetical protein
VANERVGYTVGVAVTTVGGVFVAVVAGTLPTRVDIVNDPWFWLPMSVAFVGCLILALTGTFHFRSWWRERPKRHLAKRVALATSIPGPPQPAAVPTPPAGAKIYFDRLGPTASLRSSSIAVRSGLAENVRDLLVEGHALRARIPDSVFVATNVTEVDVSDWEGRVAAVLRDKLNYLDQFNSEPAETVINTFAHPLAVRLDHRLCVLDAIRVDR